jgi:hypothetical protein
VCGKKDIVCKKSRSQAEPVSKKLSPLNRVVGKAVVKKMGLSRVVSVDQGWCRSKNNPLTAFKMQPL